MAKFMRMDDHLRQEVQKPKSSGSNLWAGALLAGLLLQLLSLLLEKVPLIALPIGRLGFIMLAAGALLAFVQLIIFSLNTQRANIAKAGLEGEANAAQSLTALPDSYTVLQNLPVTFEGNTSELDLTIVGPSGVYVVEVKNLRGKIRGNFQGHDWQQRKISRHGRLYQKAFYNPVKQVGTHVWRLVRVLRANGFRARVNGVVLFTNPEAKLQLEGTPGDTAVFAAGDGGYDRLQRMILSGREVLRPEEVQAITNLLTGAAAPAQP